ncbi:MAG: hypothetical protein QM725_12065 [Lacibacter sp.]
MDKNDVFIKKITDYLKKDIDSFIKAVGVEFKTNPFTIYGLNISVYLLKSNRNVNNEEVYEVYSLDCSQNLDYYNSIWKKYLETHDNRYSKFEFNEHEKRGWYDKDVPFPKQKKILDCFKDLKQLEKVSEVVLSNIEKEEKPNTDSHFIKVDDGWVKFIEDVEKNGIERAFNLSWVSSYIHIPNSEYLEYPKWYVSCYLLIDVADKISDKRFYKKALRPAINKMLFNASLSFHELLIEEKQQDLELQAIRAAISQVMARNMSHNIGSHVLSKFKDEKEISDVCITGNKNKQFTGEPNFYAGSDYLTKGSNLIAYFNEYLKNRMDFLADIATTDPVMETPMYLFRDILKGFDKNRILLNRISGVSTDRKFKIIVPDKTGNVINNLNHNDDPLLSIPNEILGAQAFYILLENIIRNIYKHGNPEKDIEIKIEVKEYEKDASFYELSIYDNIAKENIDDAVTNRNAAFNDSVLDKNKKALRPNNLGTIEMDVCAAYLRCLPIISIEDEKYSLQNDNNIEIPRLIYAYKHKLSDAEFSLGYKIHIAKPKEILVVTDSSSIFNIKDCKDEKELAKAGIKVIAKGELEKSDPIYNHQILYSLVSGEELINILEKKKKQATLPKRIVYSNEQIALDSAEKFIESVWEQYALKFFNGNITYCLKNGNRLLCINTSANNIQLSNECNVPNCFSTYIDNHNEKWNENGNHKYYDMACSHSKISKLTTRIFQSKKTKTIAEYLEIINTKIIVLDERIQQNISNENRKYTANQIETPLTEYFEKQKLFIPKQSDCDLNEISFGTLAESDCENGKTVSSAICRYIKGQLTGTDQADFVIIHLGILEKMLPSGEDKKLNDIDDLIKQIFNNERKRLIVTSGRGKPNNLPDDIPFVPLALVQNAVETLFDKFLLTKILFNARKSV